LDISPLRTTPFGPYGGLLQGFLHPDRQTENQERLEALGAGSGAADVEYEQFLKAKEVRQRGEKKDGLSLRRARMFPLKIPQKCVL